MTKDIVEFVEDICGAPLLDCQKHMLREIQDRGPDCRIVMCKDHGKYDLRTMTWCAKTIFGGENNGSYSV